MMGSPYYYDVLFDDAPGDVVFHDCMWSGICTCCIQLLHQESYFHLPMEVKDDDINNQQQQQTQCKNQPALDNSTTATTTTSTSTLDIRTMRQVAQARQGDLDATLNDTTSSSLAAKHSHSSNINNTNTPLSERSAHQQYNNIKLESTATTPSSIAISPTNNNNNNTSINNNNNNSRLSHQVNNHHNHRHSSTNGRFLDPNSASDLNTVVVRSASSSNRNSPDNSNSSSLSSAPSSSASSTSTSPKPLRRREHNDSERKRRDHLRNAFNFLRDQVPRFKQMNKKPPRIQILHEATKYVQSIMKESLELEQRLEEQRAKHARLKQQQFM